jgi:hypothetical protein
MMLSDAEVVSEHTIANISWRKRPREIFPLIKVIKQMMARRMTPFPTVRLQGWRPYWDFPGNFRSFSGISLWVQDGQRLQVVPLDRARRDASISTWNYPNRPMVWEKLGSQNLRGEGGGLRGGAWAVQKIICQADARELPGITGSGCITWEVGHFDFTDSTSQRGTLGKSRKNFSSLLFFF